MRPPTGPHRDEWTRLKLIILATKIPLTTPGGHGKMKIIHYDLLKPGEAREVPQWVCGERNFLKSSNYLNQDDGLGGY